MPISHFKHAKITGIIATVPAVVKKLADEPLFHGNPIQIERIKQSVGLSERVVTDATTTTVDLSEDAAKALLQQLNILPESIDAIICVTQTGDYILPCSAAVLHQRLELKKECAGFDVNLGCSGYVYGLWLAFMMVECGGCHRVLLACGDTTSKLVHSKDKSTLPLFGDAGTATLIERSDIESSSFFNLFTDGVGYPHLIVPAGGFRIPKSSETNLEITMPTGSITSDESIQMNGGEVFNFTLREVPSSIEALLQFSSIDKSQIQYAVFHQANKYIVQNLVRRLKIPIAKAPTNAIEKYGNQSSASIPVTILEACLDLISTESTCLLLSGFGVGLSWANAILQVGPIVCQKPRIYP